MIDWLDLTAVGSSVAGLVAFLVVHVAAFRYVRPDRIWRALLSSFVLGSVLVIAVPVWLVARAPGLLVAPTTAAAITAVVAFALYFFLVVNYMVWVFGMGEVAIRIRVLREIDSAPEKALTSDGILERYNADTVLQTRLARLTATGHLRREGGRYRVARRALPFHDRLLRMMRSLFRIAPVDAIPRARHSTTSYDI